MRFDLKLYANIRTTGSKMNLIFIKIDEIVVVKVKFQPDASGIASFSKKCDFLELYKVNTRFLKYKSA